MFGFLPTHVAFGRNGYLITANKQAFGAVVVLLPFITIYAAMYDSLAAYITLSDTSCTCFSLSSRIFDCKHFQRTVGTALYRSGKKGRRGIGSSDMARERVGRFLDSAGYLDVRWDTASGLMQKIYPGKRYIIIGERIEFGRRFNNDTIILPSTNYYPRPFDASEINYRVHEIADALMRAGYPFPEIVTDFEAVGKKKDTILTRLYITTDSLYRFSSPYLGGTFTTARSVLQRDIVIVNNALFSIDAINRSVERLESRTYISQATAKPPLIITSADTSTEAKGRVMIPLYIADRSGMGLEGAIGLETRENESPLFHGNLEFTFLNLFHAGEQAGLSYTGDRDRQRMDGFFLRPWLLGFPLSVTLGGGLEIEKDNYGYLYGNLGLLYETGLRWHTGIELTGNNVTENSDDTSATGSFSGLDIVVMRDAESLEEGTFSRQLYLATGSGFSRKKQRYSRSHVDFSIALHIPLFRKQAFFLRGFSGHIISNEERLVASEKYRVGGNRTIRGYTEDEYAFRTVLYGTMEYLFYFQKNASVFFLCDGGVGFERGIDVDRTYTKMIGYGVGVRLPVALGTLSVEWARNITDRRSPGRIHVRLQNQISYTVNNRVSPIRKR